MGRIYLFKLYVVKKRKGKERKKKEKERKKEKNCMEILVITLFSHIGSLKHKYSAKFN